eukprot:955166-Prorocentrum_minimum.AAC.4
MAEPVNAENVDKDKRAEAVKQVEETHNWKKGDIQKKLHSKFRHGVKRSSKDEDEDEETPEEEKVSGGGDPAQRWPGQASPVQYSLVQSSAVQCIAVQCSPEERGPVQSALQLMELEGRLYCTEARSSAIKRAVV